MLDTTLSLAHRWMAIFLLALFWAASASAHPWSTELADPTARAHAMNLAAAYHKAGGDPADKAFQELFLKDPTLTRRAFVALLDYGLDVEEAGLLEDAEGAGAMAGVLAQLISEQFGDPKPWEICQGLGVDITAALQSLVAYAGTLDKSVSEGPGPQGSYTSNVSKASDYPPEAWAVMRPYMLKLNRLQFATAMANPELMIAELDTFEQVETRFEKEFMAMGASAEEAEMDEAKDNARVLELKKLTVMADVGLLDEFEKKVNVLLAKETDMQASMAVLLSGFRAASRQNRKDLAKGYLAQAREIMDRPETPGDPVMEYALRTAEFQLRRLNGYTPTEQEMVTDFRRAWSALAGYQPLTFVHHEANWYHGRLATRYWMDQLSQYPTAAESEIGTVVARLIVWADLLQTTNVLEGVDGDGTDDALLRPAEVFGAVNFFVALADQLACAFESMPSVAERNDTVSTVASLEELADLFLALPDELTLASETGEGFPPYDVASGGIIPELAARSAYLRGLARELPPEQRAAELASAITKVRTTKNPEMTVDYLIKAGLRLNELGHHEQALAAWKEALSIADDLSFVLRGLDAATLLAQEYGRQGDWKNASLYADRAADKIETTVPMLGMRTPEGQEMAQKNSELMELSVKAAVESEDPTRALAVLTRGQQVQSAAAQMEGQKAAQAEARDVLAQEGQVVALASEVKRLEAMPASPTRNSLLESTQGLLADSKAKFLTESRTLRQKYSGLYNQILRFDPLNLPDIQKTLPPDVAVVQYFPTDDALYIFLVTRDSFRLRQVATSRQALEASTRAYTKAIRRAVDKDPVVASESRKLYDAMFLPVEQDIAACKTLVLIPSGRLNSLPFASLTNKAGEPLGQSKQLLELAKPTDLMRMDDAVPRPIDSVVAFTNATGDLPAAGKEGEQIAALFEQGKVKVFEGGEATKAAFVKFGGQAEALHLATHGEWNVEDSLANYLAMADSQTVAQDEIFQLSLDDTSLVILSACNTAMGDGGDVKYVASLAEAFWIAGSRSVVASLWAVNDASTSLLMTEFYKALRAGDSKAEALRKAQMAVRAKPEFSHPYFWSGFILFGDWR